eukprot:scaffold11219_cov66-Phaeocystis_antarctica.AAC.3
MLADDLAEAKRSLCAETPLMPISRVPTSTWSSASWSSYRNRCGGRGGALCLGAPKLRAGFFLRPPPLGQVDS